MNAVQQILVTKRFLDEVNCALLHGFNGHGHITVTGNENDGQGIATFQQYLLEFETTEARHADIQYQATRSIVAYVFEELVAGAENFVLQVHGIHERLHREPDCRIVVDDENRRTLMRFLRHCATDS